MFRPIAGHGIVINAVMTNLPTRFSDWFAARAWHAHDHQLAMLDAAKAGEDALLITDYFNNRVRAVKL